MPDNDPRPQTYGAAMVALEGCRDALCEALAELRHAHTSRERMARHALRYRAYSRADADAVREYRENAWRMVRRVVALERTIRAALADLTITLPATPADEARATRRAVRRLERAVSAHTKKEG